MATEPWVSIDEVAAHLGVRRDSVYRWIEGRGLPARKIGKLWKLRISEVDAWLQNRLQNQPPDGRHRAAQPRSPGPAAEAAPPVLIVDDDDALRETLGEFLEDSGRNVLLARDGLEALQLLGAPSTPRPCLALIDLVMPRMDGWTLRELLARDAELRRVPVILMTAERRADLRGHEVVRKPLDLAVLTEVMRKALEGVR